MRLYYWKKSLSSDLDSSTPRALCVNLEKARLANINLEGFGGSVAECFSNVAEEVKQESSVFELI